MSKRQADEPDGGSKKSKILRQLWPHQRSAIAWMLKRELPSQRGHPSGGILGDEMGLGKTASILGLIFFEMHRQKRHQNLIVVPASLLLKWRDEWFKHFDVDEHSVLLYHGDNRQKCVKWSNKQQRWCLDPRARIVITTYGQVLSDHKASMAAPDQEPLAGCLSRDGYRFGILGAVEWHRIVLDESHLSIQNIKAKRFAALSWLQSLRRWAVTGTCHTNSWTDVAAICRWINVAPYSELSWWKDNWTLPDPVKLWRFGDKKVFHVEARLQGFTREDVGRETPAYILIRHKTLIKSLPSITIENVKIDFSRGEVLAYDCIACEFRRALARYFAPRRRSNNEPSDQPVESDRAQLFRVLCKYLTKIRQFCNHPRLAEGARSTERFRYIQGNQNGMCISCSEQEGKLVLVACGHYLCQCCFKQLGDHCPTCIEPEPEQPKGWKPLYNGSPELVCRHCKARGHSNWTHEECSLRQPTNDNYDYSEIGHSTKFEAVLRVLDLWKQRDCEDGISTPFKVVIFSQWVSSFNLLEPVLEANGWNSLRFTGEITNLEERADLLKQFARDANLSILLCGLKVGGVGLDLVMANRVVMLEPWFNLPVEEQATDRLHRMGQTRPVQVVKFTMAWSAEDWIGALQQKKQAESRWLRGEWNGERADRHSQFSSKDLDGLQSYLKRTYYLDHRMLK